MADQNLSFRNNISKCLFHDRGYCKFRSHCRKQHFQGVCQQNQCDRKCQNRHPKPCKFLDQCKFLRKNICAYAHASIASNLLSDDEEVSKLMEEIRLLKTENETKIAKIKDLEDHLENLATVKYSKVETDVCDVDLLKVLKMKVEEKETETLVFKQNVTDLEIKLESSQTDLKSLKIKQKH